MKKKLLTLAVAAALPMATQAANAEVTIYGKIHVSIDYLSADQNDVTGNPNDGKNDSLWDVTSRASRLGFKGSEDLGDGLKMIWKIESQIDVADNGGAKHEGKYWRARNAYIGLAGNWGTFLYGRHDTPMKISTGKLDIFADTIADYNQMAGLVDIRANDAVAYVSPNFNGLTLVGAIVPDADYVNTVQNQGDFAGAYSLAAMYSNGGLFLAAAYESIDDLLEGAVADPNGVKPNYSIDASHWRIGGGYDFGDFHIGAVYADQDAGTLIMNNSTGGAPFMYTNPVTGKSNYVDLKSFTINGSYKFGNNVVKAAWGRYDFSDKIPVYQQAGKPAKMDDTFNSWAIGLDHNFSKRSKVYVIYAASDFALNGTNYTSGSNGAREQSAFSVGMVHSF